MAANSASRPPNTSLTMRRITRIGCLAGMRASMSTYENIAPVVASDPRIAAIPRCSMATRGSDLRYAVTDDFFNGLLVHAYERPALEKSHDVVVQSLVVDKRARK